MTMEMKWSNALYFVVINSFPLCDSSGDCIIPEHGVSTSTATVVQWWCTVECVCVCGQCANIDYCGSSAIVSIIIICYLIH